MHIGVTGGGSHSGANINLLHRDAGLEVNPGVEGLGQFAGIIVSLKAAKTRLPVNQDSAAAQASILEHCSAAAVGLGVQQVGAGQIKGVAQASADTIGTSGCGFCPHHANRGQGDQNSGYCSFHTFITLMLVDQRGIFVPLGRPCYLGVQGDGSGEVD